MPYVFSVLGPPAWLVWGLGGFPLFVLGSMCVLTGSTATLFLWSRFGSRPVFATGLTITALLWLAAGWFAWFGAFG
jgi:hypothetical protein